jgi:HPr kinase/phosphorylase
MSITLHGVFMEIAGLGVLLSGASGVGKGELALELITRGHRLVADDTPEFTQDKSGSVIGMCPAILQDFLEVRALGVLNIRALFGAQAICPQAPLDLIVQLEQNAEPASRDIDNPAPGMHSVLDTSVPEIILQLLPGRNLAILTECLARGHRLQLQNYNAACDFNLLQRQAIARFWS